MEEFQQLIASHVWVLPIFIILIIWDVLWKLIAMWKSARNNQPGWYICIIVFNTVGILPIIYILLQRKKRPVNNNYNRYVYPE